MLIKVGGVGPSGLVVDPQRIRGEDRRSREDLAGGTVRWGLQSLGSRAWPDRSAPASAMGISGLHPARSAFARIGGFGRALIACIGGFLNLGTITRLGCDFEGPFRDRAGNQTLRADRDRHGKPPRAARDNAWKGHPSRLGRTEDPQTSFPSTVPFLRVGRAPVPTWNERGDRPPIRVTRWNWGCVERRNAPG